MSNWLTGIHGVSSNIPASVSFSYIKPMARPLRLGFARDIGQEILDGIKAIKSGKGKRHVFMLPDVYAIRESMNLSQSVFTAMLGVNSRTLQDWEQGRRKPSGPALSLLKEAAKRPDAIREAIEHERWGEIVQ